MDNGKTKLQVNGDCSKIVMNRDRNKNEMKEIDEVKEVSADRNRLPVDRGWAWIIVLGEFGNIMN